MGSFNVRGLTKSGKQEQLVRDVIKYDTDICCLQEKKIKTDTEIDIKGNKILTFHSNSKHYGNGFVISKKRICVLQLKTDMSTNNEEKNTK